MRGGEDTRDGDITLTVDAGADTLARPGAEDIDTAALGRPEAEDTALGNETAELGTPGAEDIERPGPGDRARDLARDGDDGAGGDNTRNDEPSCPGGAVSEVLGVAAAEETARP